MADKTGIQWTDATWNPMTGCTKVSPGCAHCYAETIAVRLWPTTYPRIVNFTPLGDGTLLKSERARAFTDVMTHTDRLDQPLRWKKPRRIFVNSMSDLFHENVPDTFILSVFTAMERASQHTFQILTKRAARMKDIVEWVGRKFRDEGDLWPLPNVWLGVSCENQRFADERIPLLLQTPAAVRFISAEPLLEEVSLRWLAAWPGSVRGAALKPPPATSTDHLDGLRCLDWVIVGGESGADAQVRPFNVAWARSIVRQCKAAGVAVFVKQLGRKILDRNDAGFDGCTPTSWPEAIEMRDGIEDNPHGFREEWQGADVRVRLLDSHGGDMAEWPEDIRVREFPSVEVAR